MLEFRKQIRELSAKVSRKDATIDELIGRLSEE